MSSGLLEWVTGVSAHKDHGFGISPGIVKDNLNLLSEGRIEVKVSAHPEFNPLARLVGLGGGSGRGVVWAPQIGDEVLVAYNKNDQRDAYILGGLWSTTVRPPEVVSPTDFMTKRIIKTGIKDSPFAHTVVIDDALQSIKITTSTEHEITLDPEKIEISTSKGVHTISLNILDVPPSIEISSKGDITLSAPLGKISLQALQLEMSGEVSTSISSEGTVSVEGLSIELN
jgi:Type VI secretion system/phage-baseplate injector OB domain